MCVGVGLGFAGGFGLAWDVPAGVRSLQLMDYSLLIGVHKRRFLIDPFEPADPRSTSFSTYIAQMPTSYGRHAELPPLPGPRAHIEQEAVASAAAMQHLLPVHHNTAYGACARCRIQATTSGGLTPSLYSASPGTPGNSLTMKSKSFSAASLNASTFAVPDFDEPPIPLSSSFSGRPGRPTTCLSAPSQPSDVKEPLLRDPPQRARASSACAASAGGGADRLPPPLVIPRPRSTRALAEGDADASSSSTGGMTPAAALAADGLRSGGSGSFGKEAAALTWSERDNGLPALVVVGPGR